MKYLGLITSAILIIACDTDNKNNTDLKQVEEGLQDQTTIKLFSCDNRFYGVMLGTILNYNGTELVEITETIIQQEIETDHVSYQIPNRFIQKGQKYYLRINENTGSQSYWQLPDSEEELAVEIDAITLEPVEPECPATFKAPKAEVSEDGRVSTGKLDELDSSEIKEGFGL